jgi:hypothetical protein
MNSGFYPNVVGIKRRVQTESGGFQVPFYFGGSQVPDGLGLPKGSYSGAGILKDKSSKTDGKVFHQKGKYVVKPYKIPYVK